MPQDPGQTDRSTRDFAAVGDSITAGVVAMTGDGEPSVGSWVQSAASLPLTFAGGWAVPGATTADMLQGVQPVDADSLVLLGGTNDIVQGIDPADTLVHLTSIARTVGIEDVLLVAVPPLDSDPEGSVRLDEQLQTLADQEGWQYLDPWEGIGAGGVYLPGASSDGVHPVPEAADLVGTRIRSALLYGAGA
ncbi:SGNH/GDSL hydrolase family protein [Goekera deserti]|uniref:SGNH hydrolase-type esterase domain-containing protein n=1 Tax=Goekera deserti TaxID=2497753 RepID=A0A7K3W9E8_9ACTN|nr:SGNH/GDSL hydrolase family protein [Goekera deserti]NDI49497.1 hypothetical protein [Goekera deserti]NEL52629.1 hypothetical protein [Goekera deserti]